MTHDFPESPHRVSSLYPGGIDFAVHDISARIHVTGVVTCSCFPCVPRDFEIDLQADTGTSDSNWSAFFQRYLQATSDNERIMQVKLCVTQTRTLTVSLSQADTGTFLLGWTQKLEYVRPMVAQMQLHVSGTFL